MFERSVFSFDNGITGDIPGVSQANREGIFSRRLHRLPASRDVRDHTKRVVRRPVALFPDQAFFPRVPPLFLPRDRLITCSLP